MKYYDPSDDGGASLMVGCAAIILYAVCWLVSIYVVVRFIKWVWFA